MTIIVTKERTDDAAASGAVATTTAAAIATATATVVAEYDGDDDDDDDDEDDNEFTNSSISRNNKRRCCSSCDWSIKKICIGLILVGFIIFVIVDSLTNKYVKTGIVEFLEWIETHPGLGVIAFIGVYFVCTIFFVPGAILTLGAGFVFTTALDSLGYGVLLASVAVFVGASLGAIASFLLSRYLFRDGFVTRLTQQYPIFEAIDLALEDKGLRIMVLLRLSPIIPFNVLNYVSGITGIQFHHYCIALLGMIPGTVLYVFLGASAGSLSEIGDDNDGNEEEESKTITIVVIVVGVIFGILAVGVTSYYAKQELNKVIDKQKEEEDEDEEEEEGNADEQQHNNNDDEEKQNDISCSGSTN